MTEFTLLFIVFLALALAVTLVWRDGRASEQRVRRLLHLRTFKRGTRHVSALAYVMATREEQFVERYGREEYEEMLKRTNDLANQMADMLEFFGETRPEEPR